MSDTPTISASLLAEYCFAAAPRRTRIIEMMQSDEFEPFKKWYGEVPGAYRRFMASGRDEAALTSLEALLVKREAATEDEENKILLQLDAIEHIRHIDVSKIPGDLSVTPFDHRARSTVIAGVVVRVNPTNLIISDKLGYKSKVIGLLKPYLKKTRELPKEEAATLIALMHWFAEKELGDLGEAALERCFIAEVFFDRLVSPPRTFKRRRELLEANCLEIAERWPAIRAKVAKARRDGAAER